MLCIIWNKFWFFYFLINQLLHKIDIAASQELTCIIDIKNSGEMHIKEIVSTTL